MTHSRLPPHLWLVFLGTALLAGLTGIYMDQRESQAARDAIAQSHPAQARIIAYAVENADYVEYKKPATSHVRRDRYLLSLEFADADGVIQTAELEWFHVHERDGLPVRRSPPWLGGLAALETQPLVRIYQDQRHPERVQWAYALDELARDSTLVPATEDFDPAMLITFSLLIATLFTIVYAALYAFWRAATR